MLAYYLHLWLYGGGGPAGRSAPLGSVSEAGGQGREVGWRTHVLPARVRAVWQDSGGVT